MKNMIKDNKKPRSRHLQLIIILAIVGLIVISFGVNVLGAKKHDGVPDTVLEMKLANYVGGAEAIKQVSQLHNTGIELAGAIIATYSHDFNPYHNNNDKLEVWIGRTTSAAAATDLLGRMIQGISSGKGNTPFSNPQKISVGGQEVYQVVGPGSSFYFYAVDAPDPRVVWFTITSGNPPVILREGIKIF